jgi:hypothetical protein
MPLSAAIKKLHIVDECGSLATRIMSNPKSSATNPMRITREERAVLADCEYERCRSRVDSPTRNIVDRLCRRGLLELVPGAKATFGATDAGRAALRLARAAPPALVTREERSVLFDCDAWPEHIQANSQTRHIADRLRRRGLLELVPGTKATFRQTDAGHVALHFALTGSNWGY